MRVAEEDHGGMRKLLDLYDSRESARRDDVAGAHRAIEFEWLWSMVNAVQDPIILSDERNHAIVANVHGERLFKAAANQAKLSSFLSQLRLEPEASRSGEILLVEPETGEPLTMTFRATAVKDGQGQVTAIVAVLHDVTKVRELERRTMENELFESEKLATVGRLASAVAHEVNNPLEAIKNSLYLLVRQTREDDPNRRFLEIASKETQRVSNVIRQMLGFSRPPAATEIVDLNRVIDDACSLLDRQLRLSGIRLNKQLEPGLPAVRGSSEELAQVFLNLLINAQHAMPNGGILSVTSRVSGPTDPEFVSGSYVLVQLRDTGVGIPEDQLPHIFEPFFTTKSGSKGTGLGLWVTFGIVQSHGGQLQVRSEVGQGTSFTVALPVAGVQ